MLIVLTEVTLVKADAPLCVDNFSGVIPTSSGKYYAVQVPLSAEKTNWTVQGRLQVFESRTGTLKWQYDTNSLDPLFQVTLCPDPDYVIVVNKYINTQELRRRTESGDMFTRVFTTNHPSQFVITLNTNLTIKMINDWMKSTSAVKFYRHATLLKTFSLADLGIDFFSLDFSGSHADFCVQVEGRRFPDWGVETVRGQPYFVGEQMGVDCTDGKTRWFDFISGKFLRTEGISSQRGDDQPRTQR